MMLTPAWMLAPCLIAGVTSATVDIAHFAAIKRVELLSARLIASNSATQTLEAWCRDFQISEAGAITAMRFSGPPRPVSDEQRVRLGISSTEPVAYRKVALMCGTVTLSMAENWYVPSRLTAAMNEALTSDAPFGRVIVPLKPERITLSTKLLVSPGATDALPETVLEHRALVLSATGMPLAEVVEHYTRAVLGSGQQP